MCGFCRDRRTEVICDLLHFAQPVSDQNFMSEFSCAHSLSRHHACASLSLIGAPESRRCDIGSTAHNSSRHLFCLISFRIAAPPLRRPNLIAETDFAITDTASTFRARTLLIFFHCRRNVTYGICLVELIANDRFMFGESSSAGQTFVGRCILGLLAFNPSEN
jgi:hypothetical protein